MLSLHAAVLLAASFSGETVLIDFSAPWCGPCRQMEPTVDRLAALGYPVRKVNIDQDQALAAQFGVSSIPCFVLLTDGREVERTLGATSFEQLLGMFQKHGITAGAKSAPHGAGPDRTKDTLAAAQSPRSSISDVVSQPKPVAIPADLAPQLLSAAVRLKINDPNGHSYGTGTVVDLRGDEALIVTCGHIFRDSQGKGKVVIDMFGDGAPRGIQGRVIDFDLKSDVGLVVFKPGRRINAAQLAAPSYLVRRGDAVVSIGCNNGAEPTARPSRVTSLDKFLGPPNIQVAGQPVQGRSGGGLFAADGRLIGICNAADPADDEGLYAAVPSLWALLERHGWIPDTGVQSSALAASSPKGWGAEAGLAPSTAPTMPQRMPATPTSSTATNVDVSQQAAVAALAASAPSAELICIVRNSANSQAANEVIVLEKASPQLLERLSADRYAQQQRTDAALLAKRTPAMTASALSPRGSVVRNAPLVNVHSSTPDWRPNWMRPK